MESKIFLSTQFEDHVVKIIFFLNVCAFVGKTSQIVQLGTFDRSEDFLLKYFED